MESGEKVTINRGGTRGVAVEISLITGERSRGQLLPPRGECLPDEVADQVESVRAKEAVAQPVFVNDYPRSTETAERQGLDSVHLQFLSYLRFLCPSYPVVLLWYLGRVQHL